MEMAVEEEEAEATMARVMAIEMAEAMTAMGMIRYEIIYTPALY